MICDTTLVSVLPAGPHRTPSRPNNNDDRERVPSCCTSPFKCSQCLFYDSLHTPQLETEHCSPSVPLSVWWCAWCEQRSHDMPGKPWPVRHLAERTRLSWPSHWSKGDIPRLQKQSVYCSRLLPDTPLSSSSHQLSQNHPDIVPTKTFFPFYSRTCNS